MDANGEKADGKGDSKATATMDMVCCHSCGQAHADLTAKPFEKANLPWTHWYLCPVTGEPVSLAVDVEKDRPVEVNHRIMRDVVQAQATGEMMFVTFRIVNGTVHYERHTSNFPRNKLVEAADLFAKDMAKEAGVMAEPKEPLPKADLSRLNIFNAKPFDTAYDVRLPTPGPMPIVAEAVAMAVMEPGEEDGSGEDDQGESDFEN